MATLDKFIELVEGYSDMVKKIVSGTERATQALKSADKSTDQYNDSLKNTKNSASIARDGLTKLAGSITTLENAQKVLNLADAYTNTQARLKMINEEGQTQLELQNKIYAAANRSRGSYNDMVSAVTKMNLAAQDRFSSNDEAIGFTELVQKSVKLSGGGKSDQESTFSQLTQAMAEGKMQGDEFQAVMENAPMVAEAIANYMGKTKEELRAISTEGLITSDIIKGAMFAAAGEINDKFSNMDATFSEVWTGIQNVGNQAFGGVFGKMNELLNSDMGHAAINNLGVLIYMAAGAFNTLLDAIEFVGNSMDIITPIVLGMTAAWVLYNATAGISWLKTLKGAGVMALKASADWLETAAIIALTLAQEGFSAALAACPITWIIGAIILLIAIFYAGVAAFNHFAGASVSATGLIVGAFFWLGALIMNILIGLWNFFVGLGVDIINLFLTVAEFLVNVFNNPVLAIVRLFADLANFVIGILLSIASAIDAVFGTDFSKVVSGWLSEVDNLKVALIDDKMKTVDRMDKSIVQFDRVNDGAAFDKGYDIGKGFDDNVSNLFSMPDMGDMGEIPGMENLGGIPGMEDAGGMSDMDQFATAGNPATVKGTEQGGAVKIDNEEDTEWMRRLAERDYVARIAQNTLAPNIRVEFSGPVTKETDVNGVAAHLGDILREQIAKAPEGAYS